MTDKCPSHIPAPLMELLKLIPPAGSNWPIEDRARWLQAFDSTCRYLYKDEVRIRVSVADIQMPHCGDSGPY